MESGNESNTVRLKGESEAERQLAGSNMGVLFSLVRDACFLPAASSGPSFSPNLASLQPA